MSHRSGPLPHHRFPHFAVHVHEVQACGQVDGAGEALVRPVAVQVVDGDRGGCARNVQLTVRAGDAQGRPVGRWQAARPVAGELHKDGEDMVIHPFAHGNDEGVHLARLDVAAARVVQLAVGYVWVEYAGVARGRAAVRPFGQGGQGDGVALPGGDSAADALLARPFRLGDGDVKRRLPVVPPPVGVQQGDGNVMRPGIRGQAAR